MSGHVPYNKILWTDDQLDYMKSNHSKLTNKQLSDNLNLKVTSVRTKLYEMGFYKMRLEYWTDEQITFLKANYQHLGDTELAEIFTQKWHKDKGWDKKHIEKKRRYLHLKRTPEQKQSIFERNKENGVWAMCPVNAWITRGGASTEGTIKFWRTGGGERLIPHIKINGIYIHWNRWFWEQVNGKIPPDHNVVFIGSPQILTIDNLRCITSEQYKREFNTKAVVELSDNYIASMMSMKNAPLRKDILAIPELIKAKRTQLLLNRKIKQHGTEQANRP